MDGFTTFQGGWIEVICGCMFCGKTEELIRRLKRAQIAKQNVLVFKPIIDDRYSREHIVSHSQLQFPSRLVASTRDILDQVADAQVIGIDEGQFFDDNLVAVCQELATIGKRIIVAGLDQDYTGAPFGPMPKLLAIAEEVTKLTAVCVQCGAPATRTQRLSHDDQLVIVGASEIYEARCRHCHKIHT